MNAFGWERNGLIALPAAVSGERIGEFVDLGWKPAVSVAALTDAGIRPHATVPGETEAAVLRLEGEHGPLYFLGFNNFYVITRYNRSVNYAMSLFDLAEALVAARAADEGLAEVNLRKSRQ
jgi:membrane-bound lytic murein transglycosylase B